MRVGFIGAGRMGRPMVDRLVASGHEVRVLGRSPEARAALRTAGAIPVADAAEVAAGAAAVCVCVFSDDQVRDVCLGTALLEGMPPEAVLVLHTTGSPGIAALIAERGTGLGTLDTAIRLLPGPA